MSIHYVTVMGLPGSGKTTYVKFNSEHYRLEPTDDIADLYGRGLDTTKVICQRLAILDLNLHAQYQREGVEVAYRDTDFFTSWGIFQNNSSDHEEFYGQYAYLAPVSEELIWLRIDPENQKRNILKRGRDIAEYELRYCEKHWHELARSAYYCHPARKRTIIDYPDYRR